MGRGAEGVHILSMVKAFEAHGYRVRIVSPPGVDPRREAGANVFDLTAESTEMSQGIGAVLKKLARQLPQFAFEMLELFYNLYAYGKLRRALRDLRPSIYYERYAFFSFVGGWLARRMEVPFVVEVNEISGLKRFRGQRFTSLAAWIEKKALANADLVLVVSSFLRRQLCQRGLREERIVVLPNGVDTGKFQPLPKNALIMARYGIKLDDLVLGFVGWFAEWDRLDLLIAQYANLHDEFPAVKLLMVGNGAMRRALEEQIQRGDIGDDARITGPVAREKIQDYISVFDIGVLPHSNLFGSPIVLFEFMAMGKPVVAPAFDPITDVIRHGENGLIFEPGDYRTMRTHLRRLLSDEKLRHEIGRQALVDIRKHHTWPQKAKTVLTALERRVAPVRPL